MNIDSISNRLKQLQIQASGQERIGIDFILESLHERGFGFILLIFALPMALPLPVPPGINVLLASPLILLTAQQAIGRHTIWVPESFKTKTISSKSFGNFLNKAIPLLEKIEILVKPRLGFITQGIFSYAIGIIGVIMALTVCIPVPLTNTVPSLAIAVMAIGVLSRDGLCVIVGALIGAAWVSMLAGAVIFLGSEGLTIVRESIKSFL